MPRHALLAFALIFATASLSGCGWITAPIDSGRVCLARLDAPGISYRQVDIDSPRDDRCGVETAVSVSRIGIPLNQPATMSCALAARLDDFDRAVVQQVAMADLGEPVAGIEHLGAYSCRRSTGRSERLSEHAFGRAIDISGFRLADGSQVSVERDWSAPGPKRDFLHHLAQSACGYFSVVLTPNSNREHFNHLHFDIGPERLCSV
jgi:hypothetical protein